MEINNLSELEVGSVLTKENKKQLDTLISAFDNCCKLIKMIKEKHELEVKLAELIAKSKSK
jgi:hypothetical protein